MNYFLFIVTVGNISDGKKIAYKLVENNIAACVNIIPNLISVYEWKEKIEEDNECLLIIKTTEEKSDTLIQQVKSIHNYENPEIIGFKIEKGSEKYLNWIKEVTNK